jgi:hypothetical protein
VLELTAQAYGRAVDATSSLDVLVCGCVGTLMTFMWTYRALTRRFGWGPSDT